MSEAENMFRKFWDLGYRDLLPVTPPDAEIHPESSLSEKDLGKSPGNRGQDGLWTGRHYTKTSTHESDCDAWHAWGAGVGIRGGADLFFVDVDHMDRAKAKRLYDLAVEHLGPVAAVQGQPPKFALPYRSATHIRSRGIKFDEPMYAGNYPGLDIISDRPHKVVAGVHKGSGKQYRWVGETPAKDELPLVTQPMFDAFLRAVEAEFPFRSGADAVDKGDREPVDPESLRAPSLEALRKMVQAIPNTPETFPSRNEHYIPFMQAIKGAAGPDNDEDAYEIFHEWAMRWPGADEGVVKVDWRKAHDSRSIGWGYVHTRGMQHAPEAVARFMFDAPPASEGSGVAKTEQRLVTFKPVSFFAGRPTPPRDWVVPHIIPCKTVTLLSGDGGTGKSLLALQLAASVALGRDWLGNPCKQGSVLVLSAEDDEDELQRRFEDVFRSLDADLADTHNLRFISLAGEDAVLGALQGERIVPTPLFKRLEEEIADTKPVLSVFDTLADLFGGNEINRTQTRQFVGLLRGLSVRHDTSGLLLSHPSVAGMQSGSGTSGSTAWNNSVRSRLYFERIQENGREPNPDLRRLTTKKSNYGPVGAQIGLRYSRGVFQVDDTAAATSTGEGAAKVQAAFLDALEQFNLRGQPVSSKKGANYAPKLFAEMPGAAFVMTKYQDAMNQLLEVKAIKVVMEGRAGRERARLVACTPEERGFPPDINDVFE